MIEKPTTLILGAGASMPFGFPSAERLKKIVWGLLSDSDNNEDPTLVRIIKSSYELKPLLKSFRRDLQLSQQPSIDDFVERRPEYLEIGRLSIHYSIHKFEDRRFMTDPGDFDWYYELWKILNVTKIEDFKHHKLSIITFNYDRSLEIYLINSLRYSFRISFEEAKNILFQTIPIIHIYGGLGKIISSEETNFDSEHLSYGGKLEEWGYFDFYKNIHLIPENEDSESLKLAKEKIAKSDRIYFLGFGYGEINLKRLEIPYNNDHGIVGTSYEMPLNGKRAAKKIISNITFKDITCKQFMYDVEFD